MADEIVPESKDWTWVLDTPCPECGFASSVFAVGDVGSMIRSNAADFAIVLAAPAGELRRRPDPATWSPLEYGAHVRDVYRLFRERLALMLDEDDPLFADWDQDATAVAERYGEQDPSVVATELVAAAAVLADAFDAIDGEQWQRPGRRSDGSAFTVDSFARYLIHDPVHHLHDVTAS
jgi:hypothetical protein